MTNSLLDRCPTLQRRIKNEQSMKEQIDNLKQQADKLSNDIQWFESFKPEDVQKEISSLKGEIDSLDTQIAEKKKLIAAKEIELERI